MEVTSASMERGVPGHADRNKHPAAALERTGQVRLYGRGLEQQRIDLLLGEARARRSGALIVHGDVGTGKSSLLGYAIGRAAGMRVLPAQGDEAEAELPFAALHQLLGPVERLLDQVPEPLRGPLTRALRLGDPAAGAGEAPVGAATLALLSAAARERPLLCAVDDAHWLDAASAGALSFAARHLDRESVVILVTTRDGEGRPFGAIGVAETWLQGLDFRAASSLLAERAGPSLAPEVSHVLVERTGGLPLALVDAAEALSAAQLAGRATLPDPVPLSPLLRDRLMRRVRLLPPPTRRLLLLVAAAGAERLDAVVPAAAELGIGPSALEEAEAAALIRIDQGVVRFAHQLVHSAVYYDATFFERRSAHLALARAVADDGDDRHAWHLAAATLARDDAVAAELERSAGRAGLRGNPAARAAALQRAAELTSEPPERGRRLAEAARASWLAGRAVQAGELLCKADRLRPGPLLGADIAELRGTIELRDYDLEGARAALLRGAETAAPHSPGRAMDLLIQAGEIAIASADAAHAGGLARHAEALQPGRSTGAASLLRGVERVLGGRFEDAAPFAEQAISMAGSANGRAGHLLDLATSLSAGNDLAPEALSAALNLLAAEVGRLRTAEAVGALPAALASLAWLEFWTDLHGACLVNASEGLSRARGLGQRWAEAGCATTLAMLAAVRGHAEECAAMGELLRRPSGGRGATTHAAVAAWAAALHDLGAGRYAAALAGLEDLAPDRPLSHPWHTLWSRPDAVEAAVRSGQPRAARTAVEVLERAARPDWPAPAAAVLARCRALLTDGGEAERHYLTALALHAEDERPFQHARTRLLWAEHLRRNRRRVDAREQLRSALEAFERLDARPWVARARAELRATGETIRRGAGDAGLTPQEIRIAHLVARGASNREVAEQLFLSPRTVGYHLAKIYQKLGVPSRTRLANLLREDDHDEQVTGRGPVQTGLAPRARAAFRGGAVAPPGPDPGRDGHL